MGAVQLALPALQQTASFTHACNHPSTPKMKTCASLRAAPSCHGSSAFLVQRSGRGVGATRPPVAAVLHLPVKGSSCARPAQAAAGARPPGRRFLQPFRGLLGHFPLSADPVRSGLHFLPPAPYLASVCPFVFHVCVPSVNLSVWFVHFSTHLRYLDSVRKFMFALCPHCPARLRCARARACWACAPPRGSCLGSHS